MILHITNQNQWQAAQQTGSYRAESLETEGFIHCSTPAQLVWVANQFYAGQTGLLLLCIDPQRLQAELRYETVEGVPVENSFPHVYGEIGLEAIAQVIPFEPNADEQFELPENLL